MSYIFKLARRLALPQFVAVGFLLASCGPDAQPFNESRAPEAPASAVDSAVTENLITSPVQSSSSLYPNQPAQYVRLAEQDLNVLPNGVYSGATELGKWSRAPLLDPDLTLGSVNPPGAQSLPQFMATRFPRGLTAGHAPVWVGGWAADGKARGKFYLSVWLRLRGTSYENQATGTKLGFISYGEPASGTANQGYFVLNGHNVQGAFSNFSLRFEQGKTTKRTLHQNVDNRSLVTAGPWHHLEAVFESNVLGRANGILKVWVDGTAIMNYNDLTYIIPSKPLLFNYWKWNPTWGGALGIRTRDDFIDIDHVYISGI